MNSASTQVLLLPLDLVDAGDRLRPVDEDLARQIGDSMAEVGQITPIEVRPLDDATGRYPLVAGAHRLAGARHAGILFVRAIVEDLTPDVARLREIDENLFRHELNAFDEAIFLAERKRLYEALNPSAKHGGNRRPAAGGASGQDGHLLRVAGFAADTKRQTGLSDRRIRRAWTRYSRIHPEARVLIAGTALARNGVDLDALANTCPPDRQADAVRMVLDGRAPNLRGAIRLATGAAAAAVNTDRAFERLMRGWALASRADRARFLSAALPTEEFFAAWTLCGVTAREGFFAALHDEGELDGLLEAAAEHGGGRAGRGDDDPADLDPDDTDDPRHPVNEETEADRLLARAVGGAS